MKKGVLRGVAVLASLSLVAAACGDDDDGDGGASDDTAADTAADDTDDAADDTAGDTDDAADTGDAADDTGDAADDGAAAGDAVTVTMWWHTGTPEEQEATDAAVAAFNSSRTDIQMPTSSWPSPVPPNQAATRRFEPGGLSTIVEAWQRGCAGSGSMIVLETTSSWAGEEVDRRAAAAAETAARRKDWRGIGRLYRVPGAGGLEAVGGPEAEVGGRQGFAQLGLGREAPGAGIERLEHPQR